MFASSSNSLDFLPIQCNMEEAEVHILADEKASREYIEQMWAEAMEIFRSGNYQLRLPKEAQGELYEYQKRFCRRIPRRSLFLIIWSVMRGAWYVQDSCMRKHWGMMVVRHTGKRVKLTIS